MEGTMNRWVGGIVLAVVMVAPLRADDRTYEVAVIAASHHFIRDGELTHLQALLAKHPKLIDARQVFRQPRKPFVQDDYTMLQLAVDLGREEIAAWLLQNGANVQATCGADWTPLHLAARNGDLA